MRQYRKFIAALMFIPSGAFAGGFDVHVESAQFLGSSLAGAGAGGALSSMFWNPAAVAQFDGTWSESAYTLILPHAEINALPGSTLLFLGSGSGDIGRDVVVPAGYFSHQLSPTTVIGISINAPFGLGTKTNETWAGETLSRENKLETYNLAPTIGYRVMPGLFVGAGIQVEYIRAKLQAAVPVLLFPPVFSNGTSKGDDVGVGFTLGALWEPDSGTSVGLGFRSSIDHTLDGSFGVNGVGGNDVTADLQTPEILTLSVRQAVAPRWTALGTVQWTNWSRLDRLDTICKSAGAPFCPAPGFTVNSLALGWHDGWLFSAGLEFVWSTDLTLRGGAAYEISPIQNPDERIAQLPDANRVWVSAGASYALNICGNWCDSSSLDFAYVHLFVEDAAIDRTEHSIRLVADTTGSADVISIGFKTRWGGSAGAVGSPTEANQIR